MLEPRVLLAADLVYSEGTPPSMFDANAIAAYAAGLASTNFTLRAEQDMGNFFWRLYATGTDLLPLPETKVEEHQITMASDLDVNITRASNGADDLVLGLGLIDFVGDRLTIEMDSLTALNGQFPGTTVDIDFAGGKDLDLGEIIGVVIPSPLTILDDQVVLVGTGAGGTIQHDLLVHSSSDITDNSSFQGDPPTAAVATVSGDLTIKSDSKIVFGTGSSLTATDISLLAENTGSPLVKGIRANGAAEVTLDGATLTTTSSTVTISALGKVDMTGANAEDGDQFFGNTIAGTVVTSFSTATVNIVGNTTINAGTLNVTATVDADIEATVEAATVKILTVWAAGDARVNIGDGSGTTTINVTGELTAEAKSDVNIDAMSKPGTGNTDPALDAAIVNVNVVDVGIPVIVPSGFTSGAEMTVGGGAAVMAGTKATFKATDIIDVTTTADGEVGSTAGATLAGTIIDSDTLAAITGNAAVTSPTVDLLAATTRTLATTAKSTPGGAQNMGQMGNQSQMALSNNNASTSDGDLTIAGAVAVSIVGGTTTTVVDSAAPTAVTASTVLNVGATSTDSASAVADASGTGDPGLAIAAALNFVDLEVNASLGGTLNLMAATVNVTATESAASTFKAEATSGAGSQDVGIAGALSINSN